MKLLVLLAFFLFSINVFSQSLWKVAPEADKLVNPLKNDLSSITEGKKTYQAMCSVCHGDKGKGNGAAGVSLDPKPANFLAIQVLNESDGAIFWKITQGNPPMASYKDLLTETQRWQLVNYIRRLENPLKN